MERIVPVQFLFYSLMFFNLRVNAQDIESIKNKHVQKILQCLVDNPFSTEDEELFKKVQMPDSKEAKCFMACSYKSLGMMDDHGMLSVEGVNALAHLVASEDPKRLQETEHFIDACLSVNDVEVSDGDKGCDRAALIFICNQEKVPGFDIA